MSNFILEIGSEEIPARFLKNEEKDLARILTGALTQAGLNFESITTMASPRRLVAYVTNLDPVQQSSKEIVAGPPAKIAYDNSGSPTNALLGFAKTHGMDPSDIVRIKTPKGEYIACEKISGGKPAAEILANILPTAIAAIRFPKSMRWGAGETAYARPIHWILALLDDQVIDFEFAGVRSGRETRGHRVHGPGPFPVEGADAWEKIIRTNGRVIPSGSERRDIIVSEGDKLAKSVDGEIIWNDDLLDETSGLAEYPRPMLGAFDPAYLDIPEEVLLTSMQTHQKSFGVRGKDGKLLPYFLTILNLEPANRELVKKGWEKVLKARLEDARFFWELDRVAPLDLWREKLEKVIFIGPLGSMAEKSRRLEELCGWIADNMSIQPNPEHARQAGALAKADLVSGMVGEFDSLQGVMGGIYARKAGLNDYVADAIAEQYLPAGPDSPLPKSIYGSILSVADKADTLAGCFILGKIPTGMADPNGLRRCCLGIIRIFLNDNIDIPVKSLFREAIDLYGDKTGDKNKASILASLEDFFLGRLRHYFINNGYNTLIVDAVLARGFHNLPDCRSRLDALSAFSRSENYEDSIRVIKRVENIVKNENIVSLPVWSRKLLAEDAEKNLVAKLDWILPRVDNFLEDKNYAGALAELENLREPMEGFFDKVMVLCE
ncbi:MAG: glycine--tRNA ligase subunit beta, partial [Desulfovibrio sp.]|nr:glycine--tRNA ligase subunit beta [Desulfovibrio sp.]